MGTLCALYLSARRGIFFLFFLLKHFRTYTGLHYCLTCRSAAQPWWRGARHPNRHGRTCQGSPSPSCPEILWHWGPASRGGWTVADGSHWEIFPPGGQKQLSLVPSVPTALCPLCVAPVLGLKKRSSFVAWLMCRAH